MLPTVAQAFYRKYNWHVGMHYTTAKELGYTRDTNVTHHRDERKSYIYPCSVPHLLRATFHPRGLGVQRSRINIARGGEPGDKANLCVLCSSFLLYSACPRAEF